MLTGKRFKLTTPTLAIDNVDGKRFAVTVPAGSIVKVISGPNSDDDRMVDVLWECRVVVMFAVDVNARGAEVTGLSRPSQSTA